MVAKIDRTGEERVNSFGSKMAIVGYRTRMDINVYFPEYNWTAKHVQYNDFKEGNIKCPYERRVYGVGYLGEGKYKTTENGKKTKCYRTWYDMLRRCYDEKNLKRNPTYIDSEVCDKWLNFQEYGKWFEGNYYEIEGERMCLDKDILIKHNKIYSPDTCVFVPHNINVLFTKRDKMRGKYPIGVHYNKRDEKFQAYCRIYDFKENKSKNKYLGLYDTVEQAFEVYKQFKEQNIKEVADHYKDQISEKLYQALYDYQVEITD